MTDSASSRHREAWDPRRRPAAEPCLPRAPAAPIRARQVYDDPIGPALGLGRLPRLFPRAARAIVAETATHYGVGVGEMLSRRRDLVTPRARQALWARMHGRLGMSYSDIGFWCDRDHTTIMHGVRRHLARIAAGEVPYGDQDRACIDTREATL
jgi:hypothetical protein